MLAKIPIKEIVSQNYNVTLTNEEEIAREYLIKQGDSLFLDQLERLRGYKTERINEMILVVAKKNPKQEAELRKLLAEGFTYNGVHYKRFGKSASQGKAGITVFVCDKYFDELYKITQMDIDVKECVISKYEAYRCLPFSSCTLIEDYVPNIVIVGEYKKSIPNQLIRYVVEREREYIDEETGEIKTYNAREVDEGYNDIDLSPFDGCGCHEAGFMHNISQQLGLDYECIGTQVRMPYVKGYSVYVPFKEIFKEWGIETITDIYGHTHKVEDVDAIWNISMFKGHKMFKTEYGNSAWIKYMETFHKYKFKLGISKYSHHLSHLNKYTRMNFQYLQCLDLWNDKYIQYFDEKAKVKDKKKVIYDVLDANNHGKIINLALYTTNLFEKIINGDKFYTYKFMGINETDGYEASTKYLEAVMTSDIMLKDPAVKQFIYRKLKKSIDEAKIGKIYCSGFYHTGVGDMYGYLEYVCGKEPNGCLKANEIYSANFPVGDIVSFRSPLMDCSEVNKTKIVRNELINKWFGYFKCQDVVMFSMHDIALPQQGGADTDGDIFYLCNEPIVINSKIDKPIILDIEDKVTSQAVEYNQQNLIEYEVKTRDSRIGELTNCCTSIENKYTTKDEAKKVYSDYTSLLRIYQG